MIIFKKKIQLTQDEEIEEIKSYYKDYYKKISETEIDKARKECKNEIELFIDRQNDNNNDKDQRHSEELKLIRKQVRQELIPVIEERNAEIERLKKILTDAKEFHAAMQEREFKLNETVETANLDFERYFKLLEQGYAGINDVRTYISRYNKKQNYIDTKNKKLLEEK